MYSIRPELNNREKVGGSYAQDLWKVTHRLTLNYGIRYEYTPFFTPPAPVTNHILQADGRSLPVRVQWTVSWRSSSQVLFPPPGRPRDAPQLTRCSAAGDCHVRC